MMNDLQILDEITQNDMATTADLISRAMNPSEGRWAEQTLTQYFESLNNGVEDGRSVFVWRFKQVIRGVVGLHHYLWGPDQNVWLSWFAIDPTLQGLGHGKALLRAIEALAWDRNYRKLWIETYAHSDFDRARAFYSAQGFSEAGRIENYLDDGSAMVVYVKELTGEPLSQAL